MSKYERLFSLYKIYFESLIKDGMFYFDCPNFSYQYEITHQTNIYASISGVSLFEYLNANAMRAYYIEVKKRQAKSIVEQLDLKSKRIIQKYYRH
jgi:hypothetical protein